LKKNATGGRRRKSGDELEQCRFATTAGADYGYELTWADVQFDVGERAQVSLAGRVKNLGNVFNPDDKVGRVLSCFGGGLCEIRHEIIAHLAALFISVRRALSTKGFS